MQVNMIKLNMSAIYSELGLKNFSEFGRENVQKAKQSANNYIGKIASNGDRMAAIQSNKNIIPQIAQEETRAKDPGITMDIVPKQLVKMQIIKRSSIDILI